MGLANYRNNSNSSTFFNPSKNQDATAIAFKIHDVEHNTEGYGGQVADRIYADVTIFHTLDDLNNGTPETIPNAIIEKARGNNDRPHSMIRELETYLGEEQAFKLATVRTKNGFNAVILKPLDDAIYDLVAAYVDQRDSQPNTTGSDDVDIDSI
ncbi:hypothetical protein PHL037M02_34 [Propionibacterium phage PHL037M02]|uniref:Uncharacterized protein n=2 Tax=Pahexavirus PHL037M02 TaxID=1982275 RepID=A0A0E3DL76_9CAUD|nr:hypothetical protein PHL037M02_34 [Propionibacterium phage PHL037M02]YP_009150233.1 hypothetical protein ACQ76_gp34 [Propionibacterium phage PHL085N00]AGI12620.1 hypothetical protein PHL085M01_34 [Propionibacterium phage PHL085M01]AGI12665.1 hypothetical protein PHL115M02_34 [Propionibacterium phage PHL115M02]AGI12575.1 hypothetical protein PHL037M02_34 [Propionibacterium phage PHL037M02]AII29253.1 hypothetical protein PHL085N00_34 [Propionibacterium phage PHL085N00]